MLSQFAKLFKGFWCYPRADRAGADVVALRDGFVSLRWVVGVGLLDGLVIDAGQAYVVSFRQFAHMSVSITRHAQLQAL